MKSTSFYYLLKLEEYIIKWSRNNKKQTVQFKLEDAMFTLKYKQGQLRLFPINATGDDIITADGTTLKLGNQKNGWKGVCVFKEHT